MSGTNFPGSVDDNTSLPNPGGTDATQNTNALLLHSYQHDTVNAALKAIETKLGTSASTPGGAYQVLYSTASGASVWGNLPVGGDLTGTLPNPVLAASGVSSGTYGSSTKVPQITVDGKGRITNVSEVTITGGGGGGSTSPLTTKGDIWVYSTTNARLPVGTDGQILSADSTQTTGLKWIAAPNSAVWGAITGTLSSQTDLQNALNAKAAKGANSDITSLSGLTTALSVAQGGTGATSLTAHGVLLGEGTSAVTTTGAGTAGYLLVSGGSSADPSWLQTLPVANGGTGANTFTSGNVLIGAGTSAITATKAAPAGNFVGTSDSQTLTNKTLDNTNAITLKGSSFTLQDATNTSKQAQFDMSGLSLGTTRTFKFFDTSDTLVGVTAAQTLTNKILTAATATADPTVALGLATKQYVDNQGTVSLVENETPGGSVNGSNTAFTTASTYATGSLRVYLNGQRLTSGSGNDYVEVTQGFTMQYAPATGDVLLVDYNVSNSHFAQGSNSIITNETPSGTVNGTTTLFTVLQNKYVANTLEVYLNGVQQLRGTDYTETSPGSGTFTFTTAPNTGDAVRCTYQFSTGASANADTVDGFHANSTATANTILPLNGSSKYPMSVLPSGTQVRLGINKVNTTGTVVAASYTTYATVTATSSGGECEADFSFIFGNGNSGANRTVSYKVQCDGVDITPAGMTQDALLVSTLTSRFNATFRVSSTPASGSHTWTLQILASAASAVILDQVVLKVTEIVA